MTYQEIARALDGIDEAALDLEPRYRRMVWLRLHSSLTNMAQLVLTPPVVEIPAPKPMPPRVGANVVSKAEAAKMLGLSERTLEEPQWDFLRFRNGTRRNLWKVDAITKYLDDQDRFAQENRQRQG